MNITEKEIKLLLEYASTGAINLKNTVTDIVDKNIKKSFNYEIINKAPFNSKSSIFSAFGEILRKMSIINSDISRLNVSLKHKGTTLFLTGKSGQLEITDEISENIFSKMTKELQIQLKLLKETPANCIIQFNPVFTTVLSEIKGPGETAFGIPIIDNNKIPQDNLYKKIVSITKKYLKTTCTKKSFQLQKNTTY